MEYINIDVELNENGRIIGWQKKPHGEYKLFQEEIDRFSACSGNCYRIEGKELVFDETLDIITLEPPITTEQIVFSMLFELTSRGVI